MEPVMTWRKVNRPKVCFDFQIWQQKQRTDLYIQFSNKAQRTVLISQQLLEAPSASQQSHNMKCLYCTVKWLLQHPSPTFCFFSNHSPFSSLQSPRQLKASGVWINISYIIILNSLFLKESVSVRFKISWLLWNVGLCRVTHQCQWVLEHFFVISNKNLLHISTHPDIRPFQCRSKRILGQQHLSCSEPQ